MLVQIVHDYKDPSRNGTVEDVDDGVARLMIRDGLAKEPEFCGTMFPAAFAAPPEPGPVLMTRRGSAKDEGGAA